jgi:hypothetical protein
MNGTLTNADMILIKEIIKNFSESNDTQYETRKDVEIDLNKYQNKIEELVKENEQLKQRLDLWENIAIYQSKRREKETNDIRLVNYNLVQRADDLEDDLSYANILLEETNHDLLEITQIAADLTDCLQEIINHSRYDGYPGIKYLFYPVELHGKAVALLQRGAVTVTGDKE